MFAPASWYWLYDIPPTRLSLLFVAVFVGFYWIGSILVRPILRQFIKNTPGAVLIQCGDTKVICTASVVTGVPDFLDSGREGWLTSEYGMLPGSTQHRKRRDLDGRATEIQRLIVRVRYYT